MKQLPALMAGAHAPLSQALVTHVTPLAGQLWPGSVPLITVPQVPSGWPVVALLHPWQVPLQAVPQQTPLTQASLAQSPFTAQVDPVGRKSVRMRAKTRVTSASGWVASRRW